MNLRALDLNLLVVFDAVFLEKNITRAGLRVGLSQPAVSNALTRLRGHMKDELFLRGPEGLRPTPRALELAPAIRAILSELERVLDPQAFDPATAMRSFTVAAVDYFSVVIAPALLGILTREAPGIRLQIMPSVGRTFEALDHGEIDFGAASFGDAPDRFGYHRLIEDSYSCVVRRGHPLAGELDLRRYAQAAHLLVSPRGDARGFADDELAKAGLTRHVALVINHFAAAPSIVAQSDLVLTAPTLILKRLLTDRLVLLPSPVAAPMAFRHLDLIWHDRLVRHPAHLWFRDAIIRAGSEAALTLG
jgi:DNA-binding transcriptional LysR family regulator